MSQQIFTNLVSSPIWYRSMKDITLNHSGGNIKAEFAIEVNYTKKKHL